MRNSPLKSRPRNAARSRRIVACVCMIGLALQACEGLGGLGAEREEDQATITPSLTASPTVTPSPTATSTPIPPPQGVWSSYSTVNDVSNIEQDGAGYLWGIGSGTIVRWNLADETYERFGTSNGLPGNTANDLFIGPEGKAWLAFNGYGIWRFDDPEWMAYVEEGEVEGTRLDAHAISPGGELWICSDEGLSKYDGEDWTSYQIEGGAIEGFCEYLTVDNDGNPWIQGEYGISVLHEPDEWVVFDPAGSGERFNFERPIGAFTAPDGKVWFAYSGDYILWFDGTGWDWANIRPSSFALSSTGQPWAIAWNGIATYIYGAHWQIDIGGDDHQYVIGYYWPLPFHDNMPTESLGVLYPGRNGEMWITSTDGLIRVRGNSINLIEFEGIGSFSVRDLELTSTGEVYLALTDGISRLSGNQLIPLHADSGLSRNGVSYLDVGPGGILWTRAGLVLQSFDGETWTTIEPPEIWIYDLETAADGEVWLALSFDGVSRWDGSAWEVFEPGSVDGLPDGRITEIASTADGRLCAGVSPVGISCFDGAQWMSVEFDDSMSISNLEDLVIDGSGDIYAIGWDSDSEVASLHRFDGVAWSSWEISGESSLLAVGPDGSVWLAEGEGGIYNIRDGQWGIDLKEGSPIAEISAIQVAPDGSVWVGSTNGAWRFDGVKWTSFLPENALLSGFVSEIAIANDGTIWFGGLGLARYGPP